MKKLIISILFLMSLFMVSCDKNEPTEINELYYIEDRYVDITLYNSSTFVFNKTKETIDYYLKLLDKDNEYEGIINVCSINKMRSVEIPLELKELINQIIEIEKDLLGVTNILAGKFIYKWYHAYEIESLPTEEEYWECVNETLASSISFVENVITIDGEANIDLDYVKDGFVMQMVRETLEKYKCDEYIVNLNGDSIIFGKNPTADYYEAGFYGIKNGMYKMCDLNMSCAGSDKIYWFTHDGRRWTDIASLRSGIPSDAYEKVFVIGKNPIINDILAFAFFNMTIDEIKILESKYNVEAMMYKHLNLVYRCDSLTNRMINE